MINGSRNGLNTTLHPPSLGARAGPYLPTNVQAGFRASIMYARTVPGSRLGPDLPTDPPNVDLICSTDSEKKFEKTVWRAQCLTLRYSLPLSVWVDPLDIVITRAAVNSKRSLRRFSF